MKYTKEQLQGMNGAELNIALATILGFHLEYRSMRDIGKMLVIVEIDGGLSRIPDYCNNPSDIMPLAFEHGISLVTVDRSSSWFAEYNSEINDDFIMCSEVSYQDKNPLRAIACCLILFLQEKQK